MGFPRRGNMLQAFCFLEQDFAMKFYRNKGLDGKTKFENCSSDTNHPLTYNLNALQLYKLLLTIDVTFVAGLRVIDLITLFTHLQWTLLLKALSTREKARKAISCALRMPFCSCLYHCYGAWSEQSWLMTPCAQNQGHFPGPLLFS